MAVFYSLYPYLSDVGFAGYGTWSINEPAPLFENFTTAYVQTFTLPSSNVSEAVDKFGPVMEKLAHFTSDDLQMSNTQHSYPDYESYFAAKNGTVALVEGIGVCDSRLLDGKSLTSNFKFFARPSRRLLVYQKKTHTIMLVCIVTKSSTTLRILTPLFVLHRGRDTFSTSLLARSWDVMRYRYLLTSGIIRWLLCVRLHQILEVI